MLLRRMAKAFIQEAMQGSRHAWDAVLARCQELCTLDGGSYYWYSICELGLRMWPNYPPLTRLVMKAAKQSNETRGFEDPIVRAQVLRSEAIRELLREAREESQKTDTASWRHAVDIIPRGGIVRLYGNASAGMDRLLDVRNQKELDIAAMIYPEDPHRAPAEYAKSKGIAVTTPDNVCRQLKEDQKANVFVIFERVCFLRRRNLHASSGSANDRTAQSCRP